MIGDDCQPVGDSNGGERRYSAEKGISKNLTEAGAAI
jgi:hypothetical protein